jgi:alkanesulfonate monooxygenase SsuD/methylene tetrahydromethanopterin reductase-like flavin-dependent oxidoreductase (luciferase family)
VKFGLFYEHQLPRPWSADSEYRLLQDSLAQIELADRLGYDYAWAVEHHFLEEYSHSSAPEVFLAAASQRTRRIRLGHGIVQLTTNHPARVAERVATLDLVSNGRVELGIGEGSSTTELHPFDRRYRDKRAVWEDAVRCMLPMFSRENWSYEGPHFRFPARNVLPKPLQQPHPPLWVACSQMETIRMAGKRGMGALAFQFLNSSSAQAWVHAYYNAFTRTQDLLTAHATNPNIAIVAGFMCAPTDEEAQHLADGWTFFQFCLAFYGKHGPVAPGSISLWDEYEAWRASAEGKGAGGVSLIGSPATLRRRLEEFEASHIDQIILLNQAGKTSHQAICDSLELFAREVMPEFQARDAQHQAWKRDVLDGRLELAEIDTTPYLKRAIADPGQKTQNIL